MNKTLKYIFAALAVIVIALGSFAGGFVTGHVLPFTGVPFIDQQTATLEPAPTTSPEQLAATPADQQALFAPFWEAWNLVHKNYVDQPVDDLALMRGAISGMMQALGDEHSTYMDPKNFADANASLEGEYEGIGAYVDTTTEYMTITSPMPDSPAEKAGLRPGDQVIAIDGQDMKGVPADAARLKVLGKAGTTVHLTILRKGEEKPLEFDVVRAKITIASASGKMLDNNIAYIQVTTFGSKTTPELLAALTDLMAQKPKGIILDLRNNGGGYLQTAVEVASQFIGKGVVLYEKYGDGRMINYDVIAGGMATDESIPMVVLINEGSASASEIVMVHYKMQAVPNWWVSLLTEKVLDFKLGSSKWNNGAVRITIAKWLTPNRRTIHHLGLTPDIVSAN
ncbi:MAG: S41 family peptidase [Anaerolineales bacterium]